MFYVISLSGEVGLFRVNEKLGYKVKLKITNITNVLTLYLVLIVSVFYSFCLQANMLISPTRVAINDRERSAQVILINTGNETKSFRLGWSQKKALPTGGYQNLNEQQSANFPIASSMLRFSPKQVTLGPGGRQTVKLGARRSKGLANGEYRSHLQFTALPPPNTADAAEQTSIRLRPMVSYTIPVILRQGALDYKVAINAMDVKQLIVQGKSRYELFVSASRSGTSSTFGRFRAYWTPNNENKEIEAGLLNGVHFFPETSEFYKTISWQLESQAPVSGKLRIVYEGQKEFRGIILAEKIFNL
jgi:P pilus assembly chaperone PapD